LPKDDLDQEPGREPLHPEDASEHAETHASDAASSEAWKPDAGLLPSPYAGFEKPLFDQQNPELQNDPSVGEQPMFQSYYQPEVHPPSRIPHLGHLAILGVFAFFGLLCATVLIRSALYFHLFGVTTLQKAITDIHYTLGSEAVLYLLTFGACVLFFPMIWHKGFFAGLQWNGEIAIRLRKQLFITAAICFVLALTDSFLLPGPTDAPIDKIFRAPGAAWLLFGFGVTLAPFFEEMIFRGFLLPALCTACDWINEKTTGAPVRPLDENGQPQWSLRAMAIASVLTSLPFAGMHAAQTGYSLGPFLLLVGVSLVLCWARLSTRSLAASVMVHASYNFLLFSLMMLGTGGFRHLERM
jgi:membrane protease YdiL (CAAX protease family)